MAAPVGDFTLRLLILPSTLSRLVFPGLGSRRTMIVGRFDRLSWCLLVTGIRLVETKPTLHLVDRALAGLPSRALA